MHRKMTNKDHLPITHDEFALLMQDLGPFEEKPWLMVGVSGGADSLCLAILADRWAESVNGLVIAVTIDHNLRPESSEEVKRVYKWLNWDQGVVHHVWEVEKNLIKNMKGNLQQNARRIRYEEMQKYARSYQMLHLMVGHHAQDQAETFLLNLARGSGLDGLAAMNAVTYRKNLRIVRPFLSIPKSRLIATLQEMGQEWIEDPSNLSDHYQRNKIRQTMTLQQDFGLNAKRLALAANWCQKSKEIVEQAAYALMARAVQFHPSGRIMLDGEIWSHSAAESRSRVLAELLKSISGNNFHPRLRQLQNLEDRMVNYVRNYQLCAFSQSIIKPHFPKKLRLNLLGCEITSLKPPKLPKKIDEQTKVKNSGNGLNIKFLFAPMTASPPINSP